MQKRTFVTGLAGVITLALGGVAPALAADYPSQPITIIVPSKAGGSTDTTARIFAEVAEAKYPGFEFVIDNIGGSGGQKGFETIARAAPDGYTIGMDFTPQLVAHIVSKRGKYTLDSFHVMGNVAEDPGIVAVPKDSKIKTMADLAAAAKGGDLTVAVNGIGSDDFLAAKTFEKEAGVTFNLLPTNGSTEQKAAILGGHVDASFMNLSQMIAQHKAGDAHIIAILTDKRAASAEDIPTAKEEGFNVMMTATRGFVAPAGIDPAVQSKLDDMLAAVMADPDFQKKCAASKIDLLPMNGPDYTKYLQDLEASVKAIYDAAPW